MSIEDVELTLEKALREALAMRRALQARIAEAEEELRALRRRAAEVEVIIEHTQAALGPTGGLTQSQPRSVEVAPLTASSVAESLSEPSVEPRPRYEKPPLRPDIEPISVRFRDLTATQAATIVLREAGGPLHVNAIFNQLLENGFEFHGDHPTISLAVALNRSKRFRKVAPATFDLVIRDVPAQRASGSGS
jgi:hypothetical protein